MDVVPVVIARLIGADLKYAVRLVIVILDDDVDDRDDAVRGIARRQSATIPVLQITHDRGFTGRERAPLWRSHIGARHGIADYLIPPAMAGDDDKIVRLGAILPNLAEGHAEAVGAGPRRLGQDFRQIRHAECEAAEAGDGRLLAQRLLACCSGVNHWRMVRRAAVRRQSPRIVGPNRPSRVRQPKPSAPEFPPARRSNRCDLAKSCPRTIETPWDDSETTRPSNRLLRLHLSSTGAPCKFATQETRPAIAHQAALRQTWDSTWADEWRGRDGLIVDDEHRITGAGALDQAPRVAQGGADNGAGRRAGALRPDLQEHLLYHSPDRRDANRAQRKTVSLRSAGGSAAAERSASSCQFFKTLID